MEGLGIKLGFDCEIDYCVICKQSSFAFNGVREVINIGKKQTETKDRVLRDPDGTGNVSDVQPPTATLCERLCRNYLILRDAMGECPAMITCRLVCCV